MPPPKRPCPTTSKAGDPVTGLNLFHHPSASRGHTSASEGGKGKGKAKDGGLKSYHTFSFAGYNDSRYDGLGALKVVNEDRLSPGAGFGEHHHADFEIWSYVISGELTHQDSMGNVEVLKRGDIQMTSAGTGIAHSEFNASENDSCHFLQLWATPHRPSLKPSYQTRHFKDDDRRDKLVKVVAVVGGNGKEKVSESRKGKGPAAVHSPLVMYSVILSPSPSNSVITHTLAPATTQAYVHLVMRSGYRSPKQQVADAHENGGGRLHVGGSGGLVLEEGDSVFIEVRGTDGKGGGGSREVVLQNTGSCEAELALVEMQG